MRKLEIVNDNLSVSSSVVIEEIACFLKENYDSNEFQLKRDFINVPNTKGEIIYEILVTLGTTVAADLIVFAVKEIIKKHFGRKELLKISVEKKEGEIKIKTDGNTSDLDISIKMDD